MFRIAPEKARTLTLRRRQELRERVKEVKTTLGGRVGGVAEREPAISGKREQREGERCTPASRFLVSSFRLHGLLLALSSRPLWSNVV